MNPIYHIKLERKFFIHYHYYICHLLEAVRKEAKEAEVGLDV
jgi:hypothetical protein